MNEYFHAPVPFMTVRSRTVYRRASLRSLSGIVVCCGLAYTAPSARADDNAPSFTSRALQIFGLGSSKPNSANASSKEGALQGCPEVMIDGGAAELRSPPGAEASAVRYQVALGRTARECSRNGEEISVKVGIEGAVVLGPVGQPGAYSGNLHIALRRKRDDQLFNSKTLRVGASVPAGGTRGDFSVVEELNAPFISVNAFDDYEVILGFVQEGATAASSAKKRRKNK
jgi:hypothetical protein